MRRRRIGVVSGLDHGQEIVEIGTSVDHDPGIDVDGAGLEIGIGVIVGHVGLGRGQIVDVGTSLADVIGVIDHVV